jgi:hypothetical protein
MINLYHFYRLLLSTHDITCEEQPQDSAERQAEFDRTLQQQMIMLTVMCSSLVHG